MRSLFTLLLLTLLAAVQAISIAGNRVLVVLEDASEKSKYSTFWGDLEARGYKLSFESPKNEKLTLFVYGNRAYDHLILFPPQSKGLGPSLTPAILLKFLQSDGNILLTLSSSTPTPSSISSLLQELDIQLPPERNSLVVDHFNYDSNSASEKHDVLLLPRPGTIRPGTVNYFSGPSATAEKYIAFPRAVGQTLGNVSPLLAPILRAPETAYSYNPKEDAETVEDPFATGSQLSLVTALQARNNARFVVLGSVEVLANEWFDANIKPLESKAIAQKTANRDFSAAVSAWTFQEIGVLRVGNIKHHLAQSADVKGSFSNRSIAVTDDNPKIYRVKNEVTFTIELSEYSFTHLTPFVPPASDALQLEFSMLTPFQRLPLTPLTSSQNSTTFTTTFSLPDHHGIFTFRVNYKRPFLTSIDEKRTVTVRHFAHDEWPRSWAISGGWPWIAGIAVVIAGWVLFVAGWLYCEPALKRDVKGKKTS